MSEAGYTSTEALAALAILGLALGGLASGLHVLGRVQSSTTGVLRASAAQRAETDELARLVLARGPFRSDAPEGLVGAREGFSFPCEAARCGARLQGGRLIIEPGDGTARTVRQAVAPSAAFSYVGSRGTFATWPPPPQPPPGPPWQMLRSILLTDAKAGQPIAATRVWTAQAADCDFDPVTQDCRAL